jgi:uncharacterized protein
MLWKDEGRSSNIEDRRGAGGGIGGAGMGIGGTVVLLVLSLLFGRNLFNNGGSSSATISQSNGALAPADSAREEPEVHFVSFVLDDIQHTWTDLLPRYGAQYHDARLVLFRNATQTGCGTGQTAMGPFYCPRDQKVYIDLAFYDELKNRFGAAGDFAQAYVLAHEIGHHVQHILGTDREVERASRGGDANAMSVRLELQADCYAGVWAHSTEDRKLLEAGDLEEALNAAAAVGDDRIQRQATGRVNTDTFTHGSAAQRSGWFRKGYDTGDPRACNTFAGI